MAIDNGSVNGTFVNGYRAPVVDIHDGQSINVGNPGGPRLTFEVGPRRGKGARRREVQPRPPRSRRCRGRRRPRPSRLPPSRGEAAPSPCRHPSRKADPRRRSGGRCPRRSIRPMCRPDGRPRGRRRRTRRWSTPGPRTRSTTCRPPRSPSSTTGARPVEFRDAVRENAVAEGGAGRQTSRLGDDRPRLRQRHRRPRRAGLAASRSADPDAAGHRDPRHQRQRDVRQRHPGRVGDPERGRRRHRRQHRPGGQQRSAGPSQRDRSGDAHRRPRGTQRPVRRRERQTAAERYLFDRASRNAHCGDRRIGRRKEHAGPADRRLYDTQLGVSNVRGPRHSR